MVELISKVSKGTLMDQVYIPKNRPGIAVGSYVIIKPLETQKIDYKPFYYGIKHLEPIKVAIIKEIFQTIDGLAESENTIITGSFLEEGFRFNDIDIIIITEDKLNEDYIKESIKKRIGSEVHLIMINNKALSEGIATDPLYNAMLSRCISKKRIIYKKRHKVNYKLLDLHLLKSKPLIKNFEYLTGNEKYEMTRNLIAIHLFINNEKVTKGNIDNYIEKEFGAIDKLKNNLLPKKEYIPAYNKIYKNIQNKILRGIENGSKQEQAD